MQHLRLERGQFSDIMVKNHHSLYTAEESSKPDVRIGNGLCVSNYSELQTVLQLP